MHVRIPEAALAAAVAGQLPLVNQRSTDCARGPATPLHTHRQQRMHSGPVPHTRLSSISSRLQRAACIKYYLATLGRHGLSRKVQLPPSLVFAPDCARSDANRTRPGAKAGVRLRGPPAGAQPAARSCGGRSCLNASRQKLMMFSSFAKRTLISLSLSLSVCVCVLGGRNSHQ